MILAVTLAAMAVLTATAVWVVTRRPANAARVARRTALALLAAEAVALTPYTVSDSGAAASYLLGVPVLAALVAVVFDLTGHAVPAVDLAAAIAVTAWALVLTLGGLGVVFLPAAVLLYLAFNLGKVRSRT